MMYSSSPTYGRRSLRTTVSKQRTWHRLSNFNFSSPKSLPNNNLLSYNHSNHHPQTSYLARVTKSTSNQSVRLLSSMHNHPTESVAAVDQTRVHSIILQPINPTMLVLPQCNSLERGKHMKEEMDNTQCRVGRNNSVIKI